MKPATATYERESAPHKRRKSGRAKPFKIEGRYIGKLEGWIATILTREWHVVGSYETERGQLDAFRSMTSKGGFWSQNHEYRLADRQTAEVME